MKITCDVCRDLLLLYEDDICSADSRKLVDTHLNGCDDCRTYLKKMRTSEEMVAEEPLPEALEEKAVLQKSFRKIRFRWRISLIALLMVIPLLGVGFLVSNEIKGEGICFTNLDDIWMNRQFYRFLQNGEYEKAADMLSFAQSYKSIREEWDNNAEKGFEEIYREIYGDVPNMSLKEFEEQERRKVVSYWEENGLSIRKVTYDNGNTYRFDNGDWNVAFKVVEDTILSEIPEVTQVFTCVIRGRKLSCVSKSINLTQLKALGIEYEENNIHEEIEWAERLREASRLLEGLYRESNRLSRRLNGIE
ncbi:MAG: zf-HC2 domain-containing protein [Lachnospiraceae bacterium]|nr:zf-HC2 domain-containing protein [Lachnospiraceae bacterium]